LQGVRGGWARDGSSAASSSDSQPDDMKTGKHVVRTQRRDKSRKQMNIVSWERVKDREKERALEPQGEVRVLLKNQSATLGITPSQLEVLPKSILLRHAKKRGIVVSGEKLSNSNVRIALRPYLPRGKELKRLFKKLKDKRTIVDEEEERKLPKSKYQSSKWERVNGELVETSVYGPGGPTDSDFVRVAKEHVDQTYSAEDLTRKKRAELVHEWADRLSGEYFRRVYSGEMGPRGEPRNSWEDGTAPEYINLEERGADPMGIIIEEKGEEEEAEVVEEEGNLELVGNVVRAAGGKPYVLPAEKEGYERWAALEDKDFSVYSRRELNERLLLAAKEADVRAVNLLVQAGARVNCRGETGGGLPPLALAILSGKLDVASRLLQLGANVSSRVELKFSLLHLAAAKGNPDMAEVLVNYGADMRAVNYAGWSPIHCAAVAGRFSFVERLAELGGDLRQLSELGNETAAQVARRGGLERTAEAIELLEKLLEEGVIPRRKVKRKRPSSPQPMGSSSAADEEAVSLDVSDQTFLQAMPKEEIVTREEGERAIQELEETLDKALMSPLDYIM